MALLKPEFELPKKDAVDESLERTPKIIPAFEEQKEPPLTPEEPLLRPSFEESKEAPLTPTPNLFPPRREILASYDWIDVISATGYIVFDGVNAQDSTGNNYVLLDSSHSRTIVPLSPSGYVLTRISTDVYGNGVGGTPGMGTDIDFDLTEFQLPKTIKGQALIGISYSGDGIVGDDPLNVYLIARLRKWDGSSETEIASVQSPTQASVISSEEVGLFLKMDIPQTHFKKGEQLRLTIEVWSESNTTFTMDLAHDPNNGEVAQFSAGNSKLSIAIPFKLDFM